MQKLGLLIIPLLMMLPNSAFAYKWSKCKSVYKSWGPAKLEGKNLGEMLVNVSVQITSEKTSQSSSSTTSFVSSTGDCSAFAMAEENRNRFIASTITELKMESAEGQGEHLKSLAVLYGCPAHVQSQFLDMLKSNYSEIFPVVPADDSGAVTRRITNRVIQYEVLRDNCNLGLI